MQNLAAVTAGFKNLEKHIENIRKYNIEPVVAVNSFVSDTERRLLLSLKNVKV